MGFLTEGIGFSLISEDREDPTVGLYSETASTKSTTIGRELFDVISGVSFGRNTLADFDAALARWRKAGGDAIAAEYGAAKANS